MIQPATSSSFFLTPTALPGISPLSLHDALPISPVPSHQHTLPGQRVLVGGNGRDRESTRLNSSHTVISYAVFCLKKKKCASRLARNDEATNRAAHKRRRPVRTYPEETRRTVYSA